MQLPSWAPRIPKSKILEFYRNDAAGIYDESIIDEVGIGLFCRCQSFVDAVHATQGHAKCPQCNHTIEHDSKKETILKCSCGWQLPWQDYFATIQGKQLSGAEHITKRFEHYLANYPTAKSLKEKVLLIDQVIHEFHHYAKDDTTTRPAAVNLIEGRLSEVIVFLDQITYTDISTQGTQEAFKNWEKSIENTEWLKDNLKK